MSKNNPQDVENIVFTFCRLFSYLRTIQNIWMTLLAGSQVSDCCPFGYLFIIAYIPESYNIISYVLRDAKSMYKLGLHGCATLFVFVTRQPAITC